MKNLYAISCLLFVLIFGYAVKNDHEYKMKKIENDKERIIIERYSSNKIRG